MKLHQATHIAAAVPCSCARPLTSLRPCTRAWPSQVRLYDHVAAPKEAHSLEAEDAGYVNPGAAV